MANDILDKIKENDRNQIKYYRNLETASEIALNIIAFANVGGGVLVFGVKDNYTSLEIKGIGRDYKVENVLKELQTQCDKNIYEISIYNENSKRIIVIEVRGLKRKETFNGRRYIMDKNMQPIVIKEKIFISHSSKDKKYGYALVKLLRGLGLERNQIIFTSDDDYGIPIDLNIFEYLKTQINNGAFMIYLLSNDYYDSVACLNEMGAAWVIQNDYTVIGIPGFDFNDSKFSSGAIDPRRIGFTLDNKKRLVEFKNKISERFELKVDEADWNRILEDHIASV
ncbi:toll/interleukin-1 receptor domain-containing protein [Paenibacillus amylolyticus]|uniref:toll/interleukin-1 receptor domain-containing protein n=1 Tax=Paenibacillus amylolyticus TaxID=1451 RepID=UPI00201E09AC|nr:toll/interleukin-1 receptor domain-containing protein [Paenibacillus amylolyticus]MCL6659680.1 toll/interleukin-1 receptor domain-containing protein [Paenibacillus amylolyticus]